MKISMNLGKRLLTIKVRHFACLGNRMPGQYPAYTPWLIPPAKIVTFAYVHHL